MNEHRYLDNRTGNFTLMLQFLICIKQRETKKEIPSAEIISDLGRERKGDEGRGMERK